MCELFIHFFHSIKLLPILNLNWVILRERVKIEYMGEGSLGKISWWLVICVLFLLVFLFCNFFFWFRLGFVILFFGVFICLRVFFYHLDLRIDFLFCLKGFLVMDLWIVQIFVSRLKGWSNDFFFFNWNSYVNLLKFWSKGG